MGESFNQGEEEGAVALVSRKGGVGWKTPF